MGYRIGSFNMRNLGLTALGNNSERDLKKIAEIIRREEFDVVALQEVLSEGKAFISPDFSKKSILMELGRHWDFKWADTESTLGGRREGYAFLWNTRRLRLATTQLQDHTMRTFTPRICRVNKQYMKRLPYYARFTPEGLPGGSYFEIRLICVHTYYGNDTSDDREIRQQELNVLMTDIYPQIADRVYKGNMPSYTILLGDYNVELHREWKDKFRLEQNMKRKLEGKMPLPKPASLEADEDDIVESTTWGDWKIKTVQDQLTTLKAKTGMEEGNLDFEGRGYAHDYDHFSYAVNRFEGVKMEVERVDAVRKYCGDDFEKYLKTVSDHIPILMKIELR